MSPRVMAAPNRSRITAFVSHASIDERFKGRWNLDLKVISSVDVEGPNFAVEGESANAIVFDSTPNFSPEVITPGNTIAAQVEYVGDERGGKFRIKRVEAINP